MIHLRQVSALVSEEKGGPYWTDLRSQKNGPQIQVFLADLVVDGRSVGRSVAVSIFYTPFKQKARFARN